MVGATREVELRVSVLSPEWSTIPDAAIPVALGELAAAQIALLARLVVPAPAASSSDDDRLVDVAEAAKIIGLPESSVADLARRGQLPGSRKIGKYRRYHVGTLKRWAREGAAGEVIVPYTR